MMERRLGNRRAIAPGALEGHGDVEALSGGAAAARGNDSRPRIGFRRDHCALVSDGDVAAAFGGGHTVDRTFEQALRNRKTTRSVAPAPRAVDLHPRAAGEGAEPCRGFGLPEQVAAHRHSVRLAGGGREQLGLTTGRVDAAA